MNLWTQTDRSTFPWLWNSLGNEPNRVTHWFMEGNRLLGHFKFRRFLVSGSRSKCRRPLESWKLWETGGFSVKLFLNYIDLCELRNNAFFERFAVCTWRCSFGLPSNFTHSSSELRMKWYSSFVFFAFLSKPVCVLSLHFHHCPCSSS